MGFKNAVWHLLKYTQSHFINNIYTGQISAYGDKSKIDWRGSLNDTNDDLGFGLKETRTWSWTQPLSVK